MLSIILVEPETSGNIGAVARLMENFGAKELVLVNPKCSHTNREALSRAMRAGNILKKAKKVKSLSYIKKFDYVIGTTSALGSDYNVRRSPISPEQLASKLSTKKKAKAALVLGREASGLNNKELARCDLIVTIPSSKNYPALNISHAVAIILYELFKKSNAVNITSHIPLATRKEKDVALSMIDKLLKNMDLRLKGKKDTYKLVWTRLINQSFLTKREIYSLLGFLRKLK
jgi:tRNA/rRNA methyltransferase